MPRPLTTRHPRLNARERMTRLARRLAAFAIAVPLALGGTLLMASPANAAPPGTLTVTSPLEGTTTTARTFDVTGAGSEGGVVVITDSAGESVGGATVVGGAWTASVTFAPDAPVDQTITVQQAVLPSIETDELTVSFLLPAPIVAEPSAPLVVTSPDNGPVDSRTVTFTGTAPEGSSLLLETEGIYLPIPPVAASGTFSVDVVFLITAAVEQTVTVVGSDADGAPFVDVVREITLPDLIDAPVIVSPVTGAVVTGTSVTFTGTGAAGQSILVLVLPSDAATGTAIAGIDPLMLAPTTTVAPDGSWTVTASLVLGSFTAAALHTTTPPTALDAQILSLPSNEVAFTLAAPVVITPAGTAPAELAATGAETDGSLILGGSLMVAGLVLTMARRRGIRAL